MPPLTKVRFFFQNTSFRFSERTRLKLFIADVFNVCGKKLECLNYIFCTDDYLFKINRKYLKHNFYTDIISFDLSENSKSINGEIYISIDRIKENAKSFKINTKQEFLRVVFHGALHLCGYRDKSIKEKERMREKETELLRTYSKNYFPRRSV